MSRGFAFSHVLLCKIFNVHCGSTSEIFSVARKGRKQVSTCGHKFSMLENSVAHSVILVGASTCRGKAPARGHRSHRTQFLPLFCSGVVRLAHGKCEVMAQYHVQTAYVGFKVQLPKRKIPPCKTGEKFCRVKQRQNRSGVLRGGKNLHGE